jgi:parallel beta-helix repeat protein
VIGAASGTLIDQNVVTGNTNGIYITAGTRGTLVRQNMAVGNPGIQVANLKPEARAVDILNLAPEGQTTFERNTCLTSVSAPCAPVPGTTPQRTP